jgi:hypothetical protein
MPNRGSCSSATTRCGTSFSCGPVGGAVRHRRRALRAAGGDHQPVRNVGRQLDRDRHLGRRRRARDADRPGHRRFHRQSREELVHGQLPRILAVLSRVRCSSSRRCICRRASSASGRKLRGEQGGAPKRDARTGIGLHRLRKEFRHERRRSAARVNNNPDWDSGTAELGHHAQTGRARPVAQGHPLSRRHHGQLRRFSRAQQTVADDRRRRAALHHRAQRRRQDDDDGRHHRQDATRRGQRLLRPDDRPDAPLRTRDRAHRDRPQVPEADDFREPHGLRESRTGDEDRQARLAQPALRSSIRRPATGSPRRCS